MLCFVSELIRRYRERGQECSCLQAQLRECRNREASLQQGMVGLKAEIQALVEESSGLCEALAANQHEKKTAEARATNAEVSSCLTSFIVVGCIV